jgi:flagellar basal body rod protein FlgB
MTITSTKLPTFGTGMIEGKLADPHFSGEIKIAQAQAATSAATVYGSGKEGGSGEIIPPKKPSIDYRPRNIPQATILLTETSIRESIQKYPNAKKANSTLINNIKEWYANPRTKNSPQRKAVKAYIVAATAKPADKPAKAAPQTTSAAAGGTGGPKGKKPDEDRDTKIERLKSEIQILKDKITKAADKVRASPGRMSRQQMEELGLKKTPQQELDFLRKKHTAKNNELRPLEEAVRSDKEIAAKNTPEYKAAEAEYNARNLANRSATKTGSLGTKIKAANSEMWEIFFKIRDVQQPLLKSEIARATAKGDSVKLKELVTQRTNNMATMNEIKARAQGINDRMTEIKFRDLISFLKELKAKTIQPLSGGYNTGKR